MRKFLTVLVTFGAIALLGACGASGGSSDGASDDSTTTEAPAKTTTTKPAVTVDAWAASFCGSFGTWLDEIKAASSEVGGQVTPGDLESAQTAIADLFGTASGATQTLIDDIEGAGDPDIEDGDQLVDDLITKFEAFDSAAQDAKADTEALATEDFDTFQAEADELTTRFQDEVDKVADSFGEIDTKYPSEELSDALVSSCDF